MEFKVTSDKIGENVSEIDQAMPSPSTSENGPEVTKNNTVSTNCEKKLKPDAQSKAGTFFRGPSHTSLTGKPTPFKCPLQQSSKENVPSGKFFLHHVILEKCIRNVQETHCKITLFFVFFFQQRLMKYSAILMLFGKLLKFL